MTVKLANAYTAADSSVSKTIFGSPFTVTVDSDPEKSTIERFTTNHKAGALYSMTIQSRDANGNISDSKDDVYSVKFTRSDGGGS